MDIDLLVQRETVLSLAFYGSVGSVVLWETFGEFRPSLLSPVVRWSNNITIGFIGIFLQSWVVTILGISAALYSKEHGWGLMHGLHLSGVAVLILSVLLLDFLHYLAHRLWHRVPFLWRLHRVHHSDTEFDFSLAFRNHPIERVINGLILLPLIISLGVDPLAIVLFQLIRAVTVSVEHANTTISDKWDRLIRYFIVTPNMHRVHHSTLIEETDSNFSDGFPVWDRLFGTYREYALCPEISMEFGLDQFREPRQAWLDRLLLQPCLPMAGGERRGG